MAEAVAASHFPGCHPEDAEDPRPSKPADQIQDVEDCWHCGTPTTRGACRCRDTCAANVGPGTLYPLLERLEHAGWVERSWALTTVQGMPTGFRRALYKLTGKGRGEAFRLLGLEMPDG